MSPVNFALSSGFTLALMGLALHRSHLLSALLCLEGMMLTLFMTFSLWTLLLGSPSSSTSPLLLLAFAACGASAGLALLVATARTHGTSHLQNMNILQC